MDKNNIQRIYFLKHLGQDGICTLIQQSRLEGDFGPVVINCLCELEGNKPMLHCAIVETSGTAAEELYTIRNYEMQHFCFNILPLFNPLTFNKDALSFQEKE